MLKNAYFLGKNCKNRLNPRLPPARPQTLALLLPPTTTTLSSLFLVLNAFFPLKKETSNFSNYSAFASSARLHLFFNSNSVSFVEEGRKNICCLRAQGTLSTPLLLLQLSQSLFLALNAVYYPLKKTIFVSSKLLHLFFTSIKLCIVFVDKGRKNISCPRAQGTLATPLFTK